MHNHAVHRFFCMLVLLALLVGSAQPVTTSAQVAAFDLYYPSMLVRSSAYRSDLHLYNAGAEEAMVVIDLSGPAGSAQINRSIAAGDTLLVTEDDFPSLTGGVVPYRAIVSASQPLDGIMAYLRETPAEALVGLVHGTLLPSGGPVNYLYFGPVYNNSYLTLLNTTANMATYTVDLYNAAGALAITLVPGNIAAQGSATVSLSSASPGIYLAVVSSSEPLAGISQNTEMLAWGSQVRFREPLQPGSPAFLPRAVRAVSGMGGARTTRVFTANLGLSSGSFTRTLYTQAGGTADTGSFGLAALGFRTEDLASLPALSDGSAYALTTTGANAAPGDMTEYTASPGNVSFASYSAGPGVNLSMPRLVKGAGRGSVIHIQNTADTTANITISLRQRGGGSYTINTTAPAMGWASVDLSEQPTLPATFSGGGRITADQMVTALVDEFYTPPCVPPDVTVSHTPPDPVYPTDLVEFTAAAAGDAPLSYAWTLDGQPAGADSPTFSGTLSEGVHVAGVTVTNACGSDSASDSVTVQPPPCQTPTVELAHAPTGTLYPTDTIHFTTTATGTAPLSYAWTVDGAPAGTDSPTFDTTLPVNTHAVGVTVSNACGSASDLETLFISCMSPTLTMSQSPAGVIYPSDTIHFTTAASGTPPFSFAWSVDGSPAGIDSPIFDATLPAGDHYVSAVVSNACGVYSYTRAFTVVQPAEPGPDLSLSTLNASVAGAGAGETITFIAVLRNTGALPSPGSLFTNQIPGYTQYVAGSARASDGSPVSFDDTSLTWSGDLLPGSPVVITYDVTLTSQPPDNQIHNTNAFLYDSQAALTTLSSVVRYVPGYTLVINEGAVGTNDLVVRLTFTYNPYDDLTHFQLSNNAAFDDAGGATAWLPLAGGATTVPAWKLESLGDPRQPRTVYIRFRKGSDDLVGPFMASILYDAQPPEQPVIEEAQAPALFSAGLAGIPFTATTSDDNSGVAVIQVSQQPDFSSGVTEIQVTGPVTSFTWMPTGPGTVYFRAIDRSGNASQAISAAGRYFVYLPSIRR